MARSIHKRGALLGVAALAALTAGTVGVHAAGVAGDTDDHYTPAATQVTGHSTKTVFTVGPITVTCTNSVAGGKTPATGLGAFKLSPLPVFNDGSSSAPCTDNLGFKDTTTTLGAWTIGFKDAALDETKSEPNTGDKLVVTVPKGGAVVHNTAGCVITVAPTAPFKVTGTYNDKGLFVVSINNLPISVTGSGICPVTAKTSTFNGSYTFSPVVVDAS